MHEVSHSFIALAKTLELRWQSYRSSGDFDQFVEFTLSLNGLTERLNQQNLPGLASACQELENRALGLLHRPYPDPGFRRASWGNQPATRHHPATAAAPRNARRHYQAPVRPGR